MEEAILDPEALGKLEELVDDRLALNLELGNGLGHLSMHDELAEQHLVLNGVAVLVADQLHQALGVVEKVVLPGVLGQVEVLHRLVLDLRLVDGVNHLAEVHAHTPVYEGRDPARAQQGSHLQTDERLEALNQLGAIVVEGHDFVCQTEKVLLELDLFQLEHEGAGVRAEHHDRGHLVLLERAGVRLDLIQNVHGREGLAGKVVDLPLLELVLQQVVKDKEYLWPLSRALPDCAFGELESNYGGEELLRLGFLVWRALLGGCRYDADLVFSSHQPAH
mmetsp:Transcript_6826/g.11517  ORF Transcript_6826/g.11517 Transcript_6826/m.11517 type:complete len:277 (-) Transcript_6826:827-1657(-)|eukprot:CAMPEP_0168612058 /NCGR_PEP_ID=MMETSP0449_2-20121227/2701_1 /TAXON_ID=1082188 /ORGANISM="Strombidium rassoulzadegani, Strain ras09" /LENGTH=276 /DNA_ID=CAMNT_0008652571 /DNA_START=393 /DNA_END=1223 /DNA_ORIENTATION=+